MLWFLLHDFSLREMVTRDASVETSGANATPLSPPKSPSDGRPSRGACVRPGNCGVREIAGWGFSNIKSTNPTPLILNTGLAFHFGTHMKIFNGI